MSHKNTSMAHELIKRKCIFFSFKMCCTKADTPSCMSIFNPPPPTPSSSPVPRWLTEDSLLTDWEVESCPQALLQDQVCILTCIGDAEFFFLFLVSFELSGDLCFKGSFYWGANQAEESSHRGSLCQYTSMIHLIHRGPVYWQVFLKRRRVPMKVHLLL